MSGETHEFEHMYPGMIEGAKAEGNKEAERRFVYAKAVEKVHAELRRKLLQTLGSAAATFPYHVGPVRGYTAENEPQIPALRAGPKARGSRK